MYNRMSAIGQPADRTEVTLINPENFFLFTPMLAEIVSSQIDTSHAINPLRRMFKHTRFIEGLGIVTLIGLAVCCRVKANSTSTWLALRVSFATGVGVPKCSSLPSSSRWNRS